MICPEFAIFSTPLPNGKVADVTQVDSTGVHTSGEVEHEG
jgi:hypothetical protein